MLILNLIFILTIVREILAQFTLKFEDKLEKYMIILVKKCPILGKILNPRKVPRSRIQFIWKNLRIKFKKFVIKRKEDKIFKFTDIFKSESVLEE
jgi:hypothetical protein